MDTDPRTLAAALARGRIVVGLALLLLPGVVLRGWVRRVTPEAKVVGRMMGARDVVLGLGALTAVKERTQDAEWLSMGAVADAVDAVVSLAAPGVSLRGRFVSLVAGGAAVSGMWLARTFADERRTEPATTLGRRLR